MMDFFCPANHFILQSKSRNRSHEIEEDVIKRGKVCTEKLFVIIFFIAEEIWLILIPANFISKISELSLIEALLTIITIGYISMAVHVLLAQCFFESKNNFF